MACQIKRNSENKLTEVLAPNGNPSILFDSLYNTINNSPESRNVLLSDPYVSMIMDSDVIQDSSNEELALAAWSKAYSADFIDSFGDWKNKNLPGTDFNGEPLLESLYTFGNQIIKPGVSELFESNPELANSVYESLGFGKKIDSNISINELEDTDISKEIDILYKGESIGKATLVKSENSDDVDYIEDWSIKSEYQNKGLGYSARQILQNKYPTLKLSSAATDKSKYLYEKAIKNQITPQQKQEAQQLYSNFLSNFVNNNFDTIIQDLESKNILDKKCS